MSVLEVKFLGIPSIKFNGIEIQLPFSKAEYIIYLIVFEKTIVRDKLCAMLWGDIKEELAKKSLRNAVYTIRKNLYDDFIVSPKRSILQIDKSCEIITDIDYLTNFDVHDNLSENDINCCLHIYKGDFLETVDNKSIEFENWLIVLRNKYRKLYVDKLKKIISQLIDKKEYVLAEKCCRKLIELEEFDESGYRSLMSIYANQERYAEAIKVYNNLEKMLRENLSVKPLAETREMFDDLIKKQISAKKTINKIDFYGREKEVELLNNNFISFLSNKKFGSYVIFGEAGIGKTSLMEYVTSNLSDNLIKIRINCYEAESDFMFKIWDKIFERLSYALREKDISIPLGIINNINKSFPTLNVGAGDNEYNLSEFKMSNNIYMENLISDLFFIASKKHKIIFVIDDLNWADKNSLELLSKIIFSNRNNLMILATCRDEYRESIEKFYFSLFNNNYIDKIELKRFSDIDTKELIHMKMPDYLEYNSIIFKESEGNPLFIIEMLNGLKQGMNVSNITDKMAALINSRIIKLSSEARKQLAICSMFYEIFDIKMLSSITNVSSLKLVESIEELISKDILKEIKCLYNKTGLIFTHQKIREYVYCTVSNSKRAVLHETIGEYYESKLENNKMDRIYYANLTYHFTMSDNKYKVFKYEIKNMQEIFNISHEIFPVLDNKEYTGFFEHYTDEKLLIEKFSKLKEIYDELNFEISDEMYELQIIYLLLVGRFHKDIGEPSKSLNALEKMIELSMKREYFEYAYRGYLQLISYTINIQNADLMMNYIEKAEQISTLLNDGGKLCIINRFKGYYYILKGRFEKGENIIFQAADGLNNLKDREKYILNIAACYFYIGESKRFQKKYDEALSYYEQAFEMCDENEDFPPCALIFSKIGCTKFEQGIYDEAQFYLLKSLKAYNKTIFVWGRAEVYYCLALVYEKKGMKEKYKNYINGAMCFCEKYKNDDLNKKIKLIIEAK